MKFLDLLRPKNSHYKLYLFIMLVKMNHSWVHMVVYILLKYTNILKFFDTNTHHTFTPQIVCLC